MIEYDRWGRMKYHSEIHFKQGKEWDKEDIEYLINWIDKIGYEEMSLALGRTEGVIANKVNHLRKKGLIIKPKKELHHPRLLRKSVSIKGDKHD